MDRRTTLFPDLTNQCPSCNANCRVGELVCPNCGYSFSNAGRTRPVERLDDLEDSRGWQLTPPMNLQHVISLEIGDECVTLPQERLITLGRGGASKDSVAVDLTPYGAVDKGVSREHVRITREVLIYVTDLASTNGTLLNGQRLFPNSDSPLADGDELVIGRMRMKIRFE
jgi:hypothetical protein